MNALQNFEAFLDEMAGRPGVTDLTLFSDGQVALRQQSRLASFASEGLREGWDFAMRDLFGEGAQTGLSCVTRMLVSPAARRLRLTLASTVGAQSLSVRVLPPTIPGPETLHLPDGLENQFLSLQSGLFLVAGPTGAGKSTTIASLLKSRAELRGGKFVCLEDPVEFMHRGGPRACFIQRELGSSMPSYEEGLKEALRMNPDVIAVQEIRERSAAQAALSAALSGHLVVASLHAFDAVSVPQYFLRLLGPESETPSGREALSFSLEGILVQRLVPGIQGLVPLFECLLFREGGRRRPALDRLLREGNWLGLRQEMENGRPPQFLTWEESRRQRVEAGLLRA